MKDYMKTAVGYGFYIALITILITVIIYVFDLVLLSLWAGFVIGIVSFIINVLLLIFFGKKIRNLYFNSGIKYGKAFVNALLMSVIVIVVIVVYNYIFLMWIDPGYQEKIQMGMAELVAEKMYQSGKMDDHQIDKIVMDIRDREKPSQFKSVLRNLWASVFMWVISALIAAAFIKKKYQNPFEEISMDEG